MGSSVLSLVKNLFVVARGPEAWKTNMVMIASTCLQQITCLASLASLLRKHDLLIKDLEILVEGESSGADSEDFHFGLRALNCWLEAQDSDLRFNL